MQFKQFSEFLNSIENTSKRNDITILVSEFLGKLEGDEIKQAMYLLQGRLVPKYIDLEFNISSKLILRALESITSVEIVKELYRKYGDTGSVVEDILDNERIGSAPSLSLETVVHKDKKYSISEVYAKLEEIAKSSGKGSQENKMSKYLELILALDAQSAKYATRIIVGALRLGISEKTVLDALSWFVRGDKSLRSKLDLAFGARADAGELAQIVVTSNKENIETALKKIKVKPGTAIASKLVEREASSKAVWERMPNCFVQPKLDGLRGQIHLVGSTSKKNKDMQEAYIFSRNMENMTTNYPEIIESVKNLGVDSVILDSEIIGFDEINSLYRTYQDTMKRRRKYDIEEYSKSIPVKAMCFDILYLNGEDLTQKPIEERIEILTKLIKNQKSSLDMLETIQMKNEEELEEYFKDKVENGLEGIITKEPGSTYEPGTRNFKWIKLKANTRSDLVDTIDVAILGYYIGRGDRSRFGFGAMLAGVYNPKDDKYYSIGKVGSGFKEDEMPKMLEDMKALETIPPSDSNLKKGEHMPNNYVVEKSLYPDVWIDPKIIAEIDADEITRSPNHTAAIGIKAKVKNDDSEKGLSIRFPRMKKWKRDKDLPNTVQEIIRMYELRKGK